MLVEDLTFIYLRAHHNRLRCIQCAPIMLVRDLAKKTMVKHWSEFEHITYFIFRDKPFTLKIFDHYPLSHQTRARSPNFQDLKSVDGGDVDHVWWALAQGGR